LVLFFWPELEPRGHRDEARKRIRLHLAHQLTTVGFHGDLADSELRSDLLVQQSRDDQGHHFAFAGGQRFIASPQDANLCLLTQHGSAVLDALLNRRQENVVVERLGQEFYGPSLHRADAHGDVAVPSDENDRHVYPFADLLLQIEAVETRKRDIQNQTADPAVSWMCEEILRRFERESLPPGRADQQLKRIADRHVVVNDKHRRRRVRRSHDVHPTAWGRQHHHFLPARP